MNSHLHAVFCLMWKQRNEGWNLLSYWTIVFGTPLGIVCKKHTGGSPCWKTWFGYEPVRGAVAADAAATTAKASVIFIGAGAQ